MSQAPSNLNKPQPDVVVADPKSGQLSKAFAAWLANIGAVASWAVSGALSAASAMFNTLTLKTSVGTPAKGQLGAGDAAWSAFAFAGTWVNMGGVFEVSQSIKDGAGTVTVHVYAKSGVLGQVGTLPVHQWPSAILFKNGCDLSTGAVVPGIQIHPDGGVFFTGGTPANGIGFSTSFSAEQ